MKKTLAWLTAALLLALQLGAAAQTHKDEIVYARLNLRGQPQAVYIVNAFEAAEPSEVVDHGVYAQVTNLSGTDPLAPEDGTLALSLPEGRWFYQGDLEAPALPWQVDIAWQLDGELVEDPLSLSGATGALAITLSVTPREEQLPLIEAHTLQVSVPLDADRCQNVQAQSATVAWGAGDIIVTYAILPGMPANYTLTADVEDFAMGPIQLAGVRMGMDAAMYSQMAEKRLEGSPLVTAAGTMMDNFIAGMAGGEQPSYADSRNGAIRSLQFVLMTEEIPPKPAPPEENPDPAGREEGVLNRLAALFRR